MTSELQNMTLEAVQTEYRGEHIKKNENLCGNGICSTNVTCKGGLPKTVRVTLEEERKMNY